MPQNRRLLMVPGEPASVAARAAVRLAHLGDDIEPVSATEFIWRPQPAERKLFSCARSLRVRVLPGENGESSVVLEWKGGGGGPWLWGQFTAIAAVTVLAVLRAHGGIPLLGALGALVPLVVGAAGFAVMDSGWLGRIEAACSSAPTPVFEQVPEAAEWLTLSETRRAEVLAEMRNRAADLVDKAVWTGTDRRSAAHLLGWPLWHVATGRDGITGQVRTARGWYARGQYARGLLAVGQKAHGWLAIGQLAMGLVAVGQAAIGVLLAVGQLAVSALVGVGQLGAGLVAAGMLAIGLFVAAINPGYGHLPTWAGGALALGIPAFLVSALGAARVLLRGAEQRELEARVARFDEGTAVADEASLSRARLTGEDGAERGLSSAEAGGRV